MRIKPELLTDCKTRGQLADLLGVSVSTLTFFAYSSGKKYTTFTVKKKSGGNRIIMAPVGPLVDMQRKLAKELTKLYPGVPYAHGFLAERSIVTNASPHVHKKQVLNTDLEDFFPSITANRVIGLLKAHPFNFNNEVVSTIAGLTCHNGHLPQGAPTSPILSNMICFRMDKAIRALCKAERITYSRYADDLTFSTTRSAFSQNIATIDDVSGAVYIGRRLEQIIIDNNFSINQSKTRMSSRYQPQYVTGVKVNQKLNTSRKYVREIRSMLHAAEKFGLEAAQNEFKSKYGGGSRSFMEVLRGKIAHLKNIKSESDFTFGTLYNRFIDLEKKGRHKIPTTAIQRLLPKVFVIQSGSNQGTGFILNSEWLITCSHVVSKHPAKTSYFTHTDFPIALQKFIKPHEPWRSEVDEFDLIALPINTRDTDLMAKSFDLPPSGYEVSEGSVVRIIGFPAYEPGVPPHTMSLEVTALRSRDGILNAYVDKKMIGGYSGSPVLNEQNQVVGIVQRGTGNLQTGDDSIGYTFLPIQEIRKCLEVFNSA